MRVRIARRMLLMLLFVVPTSGYAQQFRLRIIDSPLHRFTPTEAALIDSVARATLAEVRALLPELPDRVELEVEASRDVLAFSGEGGVASTPTTVRYSVDPTRAGGVAPIVRAHLRATLFHELHHLARGWTVEGGKPRTSFMDAVVAEGMATAFAREYAGFNAPWGARPPNPDAWVAELRSLSPEAWGAYQEWMILHPDGRERIGYRAGTYLVDRAIARSGRALRSLTLTPTDEIIRLAYPN
jgi:hypothetical protein